MSDLSSFELACSAAASTPGASERALSIAALRVLSGRLREGTENTLMELTDALRRSSSELKAIAKSTRVGVRLQVHAVSELFVKFVTRTAATLMDSNDFKQALVRRAEAFVEELQTSRERLAKFGCKFVRGSSVVLLHGFSRSAIAVLQAAGRNDFEVLATEADGAGERMKEELEQLGIPCTVIRDASVGFFMEKVDCVLVGAEGLTENGGLVNRIGTFPLALVARSYQKPFYIAAESCKFSRVVPLAQGDLQRLALDEVEDMKTGNRPGSASMVSEPHADRFAEAASIVSDFTPPHLITLIFTDLGVLSPQAISDELIKLYQ